MRPRSRLYPFLLLVPVILSGIATCGEEPTAPEVRDVLAGKGGGADGGGVPTVNATDPESAPQDTTLNVRVFGSGFDNGSKVAFLLDGKATTKVKTNSTQFVSGGELIANITIAVDAQPDRYDVQVTTTRGKKGVGIELFAITGPTADLADRPAGDVPAGLYEDGLGFYVGEFVISGNSSQGPGNFNARARCTEGRQMDMVLPVDGNGDPVWPLGGPANVCPVQFHVPGLYFADCPDSSTCAIGAPPDGSNYSPSIFYFFGVDSPGRWDVSYNVVWTDGEFQVIARGSEAVACQWHVTGNTADLYKRDDILIPPTGQSVSLDVVVTRVDGPCALN